MDLRQQMLMLHTRMQREAKEFPTEEALKAYLEKHPKADRAKHTVKGEPADEKAKDKKAPDEKAKDKPSKAKKPGDKDAPVESPPGGEKMLKERQPKPSSKDLKKYKPPVEPKQLKPKHREEIKEYNLEIVGDDAAQAVEIARKVRKGISTTADICKLSPAICKGNKGLTRDKMPQIEGGKSVAEMLKSDDKLERKKAEAMVQAGADPKDKRPIMKQLLDHLEKHGVKSKQSRVRVGELKATQKEIKAAKTFGIADAHLKGKFNALTEEPKVMISKDGYLLDGHHRWAAVLTIDPKRTMEVVVIDMDMDDLLHEAASYPGVYQADFAGEPLDEKKQKSYKEKHQTKLSKGEKKASLEFLAYPDLHPVQPSAMRVARLSRLGHHKAGYVDKVGNFPNLSAPVDAGTKRGAKKWGLLARMVILESPPGAQREAKIKYVVEQMAYAQFLFQRNRGLTAYYDQLKKELKNLSHAEE